MYKRQKQKKSTYTYDDASVRTAARHAEERTVRGAEEGLSSLQLMSMRDVHVQSPTITNHLQEFKEGEDTKKEDSGQPAHLLSTEEELRRGRRHGKINPASMEVSRGSLLEPGIRKLAEHPRGPLPNFNVRELAGLPKSSLPNAGIQELVEHQQSPVKSNNVRRDVAEMNQQENTQPRPTSHHLSLIHI